MKKICLISLFLIPYTLFLIPSLAQQGQWTWMNGSNLPNQPGVYGTQGVFAAGNTPPALYEACEWTDLEGNFWLFGGVEDINVQNVSGDLWEFKASNNQWSWIKGAGMINQAGIYGTRMIPSLTNNPGGRGYGVVTWVDTAGDLWLFGGYGSDINGNVGILNDLWRYQITTDEWTWMAGADTILDPGSYGIITVSSPSNNPPARDESACSWIDNTDKLWLFGGNGLLGNYSDMWQYDPLSNQWVWMKGPNIVNQPAVFGIINVPDPTNIPYGGWSYGKWKESNGNFWLFGVFNYLNQTYNDLWRFNPITNDWTWMKGPNTPNDNGTSTTQCFESLANNPAARFENRACWTRCKDNFVNFGGTGLTGSFNDLWNYSVLNNEWTWMSGSVVTNQAGSYGTILVSAPSNMPGSRTGSVGWSDTAGNLWMFGGLGSNAFNDMWKFVPDPSCPVIIGTDTITSAFTAQPIIGCNPLSVIFNNNSTNGTIYTWLFGDSDSSTLANPTHIFTTPGTYTVKLIANASCSIHADTSTMTITVNPSPVPIITGNMLCNSMPSLLDAGTFTGYNWSTGATTESITVDSATTYTVTVTNANGCTGTAAKTITVNPNPTPTIGGGDSVCAGDSLMIYTDFYSHYLWNNGDTTSINYISTAGTYYVTVTDSHGCTAIDSITITVNPLPAPVITASGPTTFCAGGSVTLTTSLNSSYLWNTTATTQAITVTTSGNYIVTVTTAFGCTGITSDSVTVIPLPNVTSAFQADTTKGCSPLTVHFINTSTNGTSYLWEFGDGDTSTAMNPSHTYLDSGSYSITLITTNSGPCGTVIDSITIIDFISVNVFHPIAAFTSNYVTPIYTGDSVHFQDESYDLYGSITLWQWWFGDGTGTNYINPIHEWNLPGMYQVELIITDNQGCKDSTIYDYIDVIEGIIEIPNTFTPNNDGYNDFFEIKASGLETFHLDIFNRWGMKLFTSTSINISWDGYNENGMQCPDGTYYYVLKATGYTGKVYNQAGFIMLLR